MPLRRSGAASKCRRANEVAASSRCGSARIDGLDPWLDRKGTSDCADEVTLSRKGSESRTQGRKLRSTGTKASTNVTRKHVSTVELKKKLAAREYELTEALARQNATAEVLRAVANSATDAEMALQTIAESVARLLDVTDAEILRVEGDVLKVVAKHGPSRRWPIGSARPINRDWVTGRAVVDRAIIHIPDLQAAEAEFPEGAAYARQLGHRTTLAAPLLREGIAIGAILIRRMDVRPLTEKQTALLKMFADQAVIAFENARLFDEVQARTRELSEALEQQTATSEVLRVISNSPTDIQPVLDAVGENAARLCDANNAVIFRLEGDLLRQVASFGGLATTSHPTGGLPVNRGRVTGRAVVDRQTIHIHDLASEDSDFPEGSRDAKRDGHRTTLATPLLREGVPIGAILIRRMEVRPFSQKQIELLTTFADQAVIAIENVRLFDEIQDKNRQLQMASENKSQFVSSMSHE